MQSGFSALRHRNYRLFWIGQTVSLMGAWMQSTAQAWLVLELTHSSFQVGLVVACQFGPILILGLFAGVLADRWNKRRTIIITQTLAALQALALGILTVTGTIQASHVMILAVLLGVVNALDMPLRQSFIMEMVGRKDVMNAVALNSAAFNLARIIGPAVGGLLIGAIGVGAAFLVNAASFLAVIVSLFQMRDRDLFQMGSGSREGMWEGLRTGLRYVAATPMAQVPIFLVGLVATFGMNFNVILPVMARDLFAIGSTGYGLLMSSIGVGSLLAATFLAFFRRLDPVKTMLFGAAGFTVLEAVFALSPHFPWIWLAALNLFAVGFCTICLTATANTTLQSTTPDELRGRVLSIYITIFAGTTPLGSLFAGGLASRAGAPVALAAGAAVCALATLWGVWRVKSAARSETGKIVPV